MLAIAYLVGVLGGIQAHRLWLAADPTKKERRPAVAERVAAFDTHRANERNHHDATTTR